MWSQNIRNGTTGRTQTALSDVIQSALCRMFLAHDRPARWQQNLPFHVKNKQVYSWDVRPSAISQRWVVVLYRRLGTAYRFRLQGPRSLLGLLGPWRWEHFLTRTTTQSCVMSQKSAALIYIAAEAWSHAGISAFFFYISSWIRCLHTRIGLKAHSLPSRSFCMLSSDTYFFNASTAPWRPMPPHFSRLHDHTVQTHHTR
jgi:hypothetical protein